jgi:N-formylglutamate deformylase
MKTTSPPPYELSRPAGRQIALLLDSPHSGTYYPDDFAACAPLSLLRTAEDTYVEQLFASAVEAGATLLAANYPRAYIDCNRRSDDIDVTMLSDPWPTETSPSEKAKLGYGLIWKKLDSGESIYDRHLSVKELRSRIDRVYEPYWATLIREANDIHQKYGVLYHLNCHSMPAKATCASHLARGTPHADIVLGDRNGSTCDAEFVELTAEGFRRAGLSVKVNDPYKGVEIVRALGRPAHNRHSLQVEVNRTLYMDENTRQKKSDFIHLQLTISGVLRSLATFVEEQAEQLLARR